MSNSSLVTYTKISPNSDKRKYPITKITIHHMAGNLTVEECGNVFQKREASTNYGIDGRGNVGLYVDESRRAWSTANPDNDHRAVNIELANDEIGGNWHVSDTAINKCILLCADICKRNGIKKLNYTGDKSGNLTMHKWFMATACPGPYLESRFGYIADEVNKLLENGLPTDGAVKEEKPTDGAQSASGEVYTGKYPSLPSRGYFMKGDGYSKYTGKKQDIMYIQDFLNWAIDAGLDVDGEYGAKTTAAVAGFQTKAGITSDGKYGKDTLAAAKDYRKLKSTESNSKEVKSDAIKASESAKSYDKSLAKVYRVNTSNGVNIRAGAGTDKKILVAVPNNHVLNCYGYYTDRDGLRWLYVSTEYKGKEYIGFVSAVWVK